MNKEFNVFESFILFIVMMGFWFGLPLSCYLLFLNTNYLIFSLWQPFILLLWFVICLYKTFHSIKDPYDMEKTPKIIKRVGN